MMKRALFILLDGILLLLAVYLSFLSPYAYEWDPLLKSVDDDKMLVLRLGWLLLSVVAAVVLFVKCRKRDREKNRAKVFSCVFSCLLLGYSACKAIWLFLL